MKRVSVILLATFAALTLSTTTNAEMVYYSQDFEDTDLFVSGTAFTTTGVGDASTTVGHWAKGPGSTTNTPAVATDQYHSGAQSVKLPRPSLGNSFYGTTTNGVAPFSEGQFTASAWIYLGSNSMVCPFVEPLADVLSPAHEAAGAAIYSSEYASDYAGKIKAWAWNSSTETWGWGDYTASIVSTGSWFGLKYDIDLDNYTYDILVDTGSGYFEAISDVALKPGVEYALDTLVFYAQGKTGSYFWVDDCLMTGPEVPEPSTLTLLAAGLIGLLAYAWKKRK